MPTSPYSFSITAMRLPCLLSQDPVEQGRLAGAEEASEDGDRHFALRVHIESSFRLN